MGFMKSVLYASLIFLSASLCGVPKPVINLQPYDFLRGESLKACVPRCPLANDAIEIQSINNHQRFQDWTHAEHYEAYDMIQRVRSCWSRCGAADSYLVYGRTSPNLRSETFHWQVVPYSEKGWPALKQISVVWNASFGVDPLAEKERIAAAEALKAPMATLSSPYRIERAFEKSDDPFCDPVVLKKQGIYEGREMMVLYNYAPVRLVDDSPHFLIIPKKHKPTFSELSASEYQEAMVLAQKIGDYFRKKHPQSTLHLFHKSGEMAGQTVPHWHMHVIVVEEDFYLPSFEFPCIKTPTACTSPTSPFRFLGQKFGRLCQSCQNFVYIMLPHRKLSDETLAERVEFYKKEMAF